jgi:hypothetical protein
MNLKTGIDVLDVMNGDEMDPFMCLDLSKDLVEFSTLMASSNESSSGIKGESAPFERDHVAPDLFLFFKEKDPEPSLDQEGSSR